MWLFLRESGIQFTLEQYQLFTPLWHSLMTSRKLSPSGNAPVLYNEESIIAWDSISIIEHCREEFSSTSLEYPSTQPARSHGRSICMELHSSFLSLRDQHPFNVRQHFRNVHMSISATADATRICSLVHECRDRFGNTGIWLYGDQFTIVDVLLGTELIRLNTYGFEFSSVVREYLAHFLQRPYVAEWIALAEREDSVIPAFEWQPGAHIMPLKDMRYQCTDHPPQTQDTDS